MLASCLFYKILAILIMCFGYDYNLNFNVVPSAIASSCVAVGYLFLLSCSFAFWQFPPVADVFCSAVSLLTSEFENFEKVER